MKPIPLKRFFHLAWCLGAVALYALTPALLLFEWLYGGGPRVSAGAGWVARGRPVIIGAFLALVIHDLARALMRGRG